MTVTFSAAGQGGKTVVDGVGPDGGKVHGEYSANFDGKAYPVVGNPDGDMVIARRTMRTRSGQEEAPTQINVVLRWFEELKRRVPPGN